MRQTLAVVLVVLAGLSFGVAPATGRERGRREDRRAYDPSAVETVRGEVEKIERISRPRMPGHRVHLLLKTDAGQMRVLLGPGSYLDEEKLTLHVGDQVEVRGSRTTRAGQPMLIAAEVKRGDTTLKLREPDGTPVWRTRR